MGGIRAEAEVEMASEDQTHEGMRSNEWRTGGWVPKGDRK